MRSPRCLLAWCSAWVCFAACDLKGATADAEQLAGTDGASSQVGKNTLCDLDGDGAVDIQDWIALADAVTSEEGCLAKRGCDFDADGVVAAGDLQILEAVLNGKMACPAKPVSGLRPPVDALPAAEHVPCDANGDGSVDAADLAVVQQAAGGEGTGGCHLPPGCDINLDGAVDGADVAALEQTLDPKRGGGCPTRANAWVRYTGDLVNVACGHHTSYQNDTKQTQEIWFDFVSCIEGQIGVWCPGGSFLAPAPGWLRFARRSGRCVLEPGQSLAYHCLKGALEDNHCFISTSANRGADGLNSVSCGGSTIMFDNLTATATRARVKVALTCSGSANIHVEAPGATPDTHYLEDGAKRDINVPPNGRVVVECPEGDNAISCVVFIERAP